MKTLEELSFPEDRSFTKEHIWIKEDGDSYLVGISDYAQDQLGEIAFIELPEEGSHFDGNAEFGTIESIKSVNQLFMPVSGTVSAVNSELEDAPTIVNVSPYANGWIIRITPDNNADVASLLSSADYRASLA